MGVHVEPSEELDDIQWLKAKYKLVLKRERELLEYLYEKLGNIDYRMKALEDKL